MSELRRRNVGAGGEELQERAKGALDYVKKFDVYYKVDEDLVQKSQTGGVVTVVTYLILAFLFCTELREFCAVEMVDSISVDTRLKQKLPIRLNITFPHLRCDEVSVDTVDSAGDNQVDVHGGLHKVALDLDGNLAGPDPVPPKGACLPCLEGEDEEHRCCNTCQDLKEAYTMKDLPYFHVLDKAEQCRNSIGCRVHGQVGVNRVSGNVHVALGKSTVRDGKHVHEFNMHDVSDGFNTSHCIHSVDFGEHVPGVFSPLDGTEKTVTYGAFMFHYYIKLVPTVFTNRWGEETYTNQYSSLDAARNVLEKSKELSGLPGVFIVYDFSPFLMRKTEKVKPWSYIFTSICALIGGVYSVASLVEMVASSAAVRVFDCTPKL